MAGHSKWAQIKHKKASTDARRGKLFSKLARAITIAAREKGVDPSGNATLASAIEKARSLNMPSDNIDRAIAKATGAGEETLSSVLYEAYGPGGVAVLILGITDNNNRTSNEIKHLLRAVGGKWAQSGSVLWAFDKTAEGWEPKEYSLITLGVEDRATLERLVDALDDHDDVQDIYTNDAGE
ncbi:MAG: YebC/PmpR family DNA-binding transcriptional regulator [Patescibacteria group bacterium]